MIKPMYHFIPLLKFFVITLTICLLSACTNMFSKKETLQPQAVNEKDNSQTQTIPKEAVAMASQDDIKNIDALLKQYKKASSAEEKAAQILLSNAVKLADQAAKEGPKLSALHNGWGVAFRKYSESVMYKPSTTALIGTAKTQIMNDRVRETQQESLKSKLSDIQEGIKIYKIAIEFGQRSGKSLPLDERKAVEVDIMCLQDFLRNPDPKTSKCQLLKNALDVSQVH